MALPFTVEQFYGVFRDYNTAVWPAQWFFIALGNAANAAVPPTPPSPVFAPLLWSFVGAQAAFVLDVQPDLVLIAAAVVGMGLLATAGQRPKTSQP